MAWHPRWSMLLGQAPCTASTLSPIATDPQDAGSSSGARWDNWLGPDAQLPWELPVLSSRPSLVFIQLLPLCRQAVPMVQVPRDPEEEGHLIVGPGTTHRRPKESHPRPFPLGPADGPGFSCPPSANICLTSTSGASKGAQSKRPAGSVASLPWPGGLCWSPPVSASLWDMPKAAPHWWSGSQWPGAQRGSPCAHPGLTSPRPAGSHCQTGCGWSGRLAAWRHASRRPCRHPW